MNSFIKEQAKNASPFGGGVIFAAVCLGFFILHQGAAIIIPLVIAVFAWYLINAIARSLSGMTQGMLPRFLCFVLAIFLLLGGLWFGYKLIVANAGQLTRAAPVYQEKLQHLLPSALEFLPPEYRPGTDDIAGYLNISGFITALVKTFTGIAGKTLVVLFYTGFLLYEQQFFKRKIEEMAGGGAREKRAHEIIRNIDVRMQKYIGIKTLVSLMTGFFTWAWLKFFGIDFAEFWGVMAFVLNFLPYIGSVAAVVLPSTVALVQTGDSSVMLAVMVGLGLIQAGWDNVVEPKMMGGHVNLSPVFIILSMAGWGLLWGVPGMFLSMPLLLALMIVFSQFAKTRGFAVLLSRTGDPDRTFSQGKH